MLLTAPPSPGGTIRKVDGIAAAGATLATDARGRLLFVGAADGCVSVWSFDRSRVKAAWKICEAAVSMTAVCETRLEFAAACADGFVRVWDPRAGACLATLPAATRRVIFLRYVDGGNVLLWIGAEGRAQLADCSAWSTVGEARVSPHELLAATADAAGRALAVSGYQSRIVVFDRQAASGPRQLKAPSGGVYSLAFHPSAPVLASGGRDCVVRLWEMESERQVRELHGLAETVLSVAFSPDGLRVAAGDAGGTMILWDCVTGRELASRRLGAPASAESLAFGRGGSVIAVSGTGAEIALWDIAGIKAE